MRDSHATFLRGRARRRACGAALLLALAVVVTACPSPRRESPEAVSTPGRFAVRGNRIVDARGRPFVLRGVQIPDFPVPALRGGRFQLPEPQGRYVFAWGANAIRLNLAQELWLADCPAQMGGERTTYRRAVDRHVQDATGRGLAVILALAHVEGGRATGCARPAPPQLKEMADERSPGFWRAVAARYRDEPLVLFDLFNEPRDLSDEVWHDGGLVTDRSGRTYRAVGMQALYDAVRSAGARNLVVVGGTRLASDLGVLLRRPLAGEGIVVGLHLYCNQCPPDAPALPEDLVVPPEVLARYPVAVTEFGWRQSDDPRFARLVIDWAVARGLGFSAFQFSRPGDPWSLVASVTPTLPVGRGLRTKPPSRRGLPVWNAFADGRRARGLEALLLPE
jgi:endoglucanase